MNWTPALSEFCLCKYGLLRDTWFGFLVAQCSRKRKKVFLCWIENSCKTILSFPDAPKWNQNIHIDNSGNQIIWALLIASDGQLHLIMTNFNEYCRRLSRFASPFDALVSTMPGPSPNQPGILRGLIWINCPSIHICSSIELFKVICSANPRGCTITMRRKPSVEYRC